MLQLVDTMACPTVSHKALASGWAVILMAIRSCLPVIHCGTDVWAGSNHVTGPGQVLFRSCRCDAVNGIMKGSI